MNQDKKDSQGNGMNIDIGHVSVTGHVVFAGRDGSVSVTTGGNVEQQATQTITIGGVETTQAAYEAMKAKLNELSSAIEDETFEEEIKDDALHDLKIVEEQLTADKKPNSRILTKAMRALYKLSPALASGVFALFGEPLVSQIVFGVGGVAVQFFDAVMKRHTKK